MIGLLPVLGLLAGLAQSPCDGVPRMYSTLSGEHPVIPPVVVPDWHPDTATLRGIRDLVASHDPLVLTGPLRTRAVELAWNSWNERSLHEVALRPGPGVIWSPDSTAVAIYRCCRPEPDGATRFGAFALYERVPESEGTGMFRYDLWSNSWPDGTVLGALWTSPTTFVVATTFSRRPLLRKGWRLSYEQATLHVYDLDRRVLGTAWMQLDGEHTSPCSGFEVAVGDAFERAGPNHRGMDEPGPEAPPAPKEPRSGVKLY